MRKNVFLIILCLVASHVCVFSQKAEIETLRSETRKDLQENILAFWEKNCVDPDGGFYGTVLRDGKAVKESPKGGVLNSRILWTFSYAYRLFHEDRYKKLAERAFEDFTGKFFDKEFGGVYWMIEKNGSIKDDAKQTFAQAYSIYGLSEYYRATGDKRGLDKAIELFRLVEDKCVDKQKDGYIETFSRQWTKPETTGFDKNAPGTKTMNTHLHILEAYASLYKVWPDKFLRKRLAKVISIMTGELYNEETHHLLISCDDDWNSLVDTESYGHDIETSWLLTDACKLIKDKQIKARAEKAAMDLFTTSLAQGMAEDGHLMYEKSKGRVMNRISWWCQTETVNASMNAYRITKKREYLDQALKTWQYIKDHLIDKEYGEWYRSCKPDGSPLTFEPKCSLWNCPYHNSRMAFLLEEWK